MVNPSEHQTLLKHAPSLCFPFLPSSPSSNRKSRSNHDSGFFGRSIRRHFPSCSLLSRRYLLLGTSVAEFNPRSIRIINLNNQERNIWNLTNKLPSKRYLLSSSADRPTNHLSFFAFLVYLLSPSLEPVAIAIASSFSAVPSKLIYCRYGSFTCRVTSSNSKPHSLNKFII